MKVDEILNVLKLIQKEQREFRTEVNEFQTEVNEFRTEVIERLETIEKYAIHNGEKLDNHREYTGKKTNFIEHKNLELEQRIYELENRFGQ